MQHTVIFQPDGRRGVCQGPTNLLTIARELGVNLESPCGGSQVCGKCAVRLESSGQGPAEPCDQEREHLSVESLAQGYRLACCTAVESDLTVFVPEESRRGQQIILENGRGGEITLDPAVRLQVVELDKPSIEDCRDDWQRLSEGLRALGVGGPLCCDSVVLRQLPATLRQGKWCVSVAIRHGGEVVAVMPGRVEHLYGAAIDIGTTTIAGFLGDLTTGSLAAQASLTNSQVQYGDDVISRISCCMLEDDGLERLHGAILEDINRLLERLCDQAGIKREKLVDLVVVFNTAMHHLFLGIRPDWLGRSPFVAAIREPVDIKARDLGIAIHGGAFIHCLPIEAGFVGADNVAVLLAEKACESESIQLLIDIGTNGEINLGNRERMLCASCATGPAFEGAQIKHGMRAAEGAIERVWIDPATKEAAIQVIGSGNESGRAVRAKGICGSGIIDVAAELFKAGLLLADGRFSKEVACPRLRPDAKGKLEYVLAWGDESATGQDIVITQKDIRAIQLAKAALYAGVTLLMRRLGIDRIERVILAGAFGSYIHVESALVLGLFPDCAVEQVEVVGNAAGEGAKQALFDHGRREEAARIARMVEFVETATDPDFSTVFADAMYFPHRTDAFPHIQPILDAAAGARGVAAGGVPCNP
ncbi:MAG: ASKHA domain-containing protein [Desulfobulbus sp.]